MHAFEGRGIGRKTTPNPVELQENGLFGLSPNPKPKTTPPQKKTTPSKTQTTPPPKKKIKPKEPPPKNKLDI